MGKVGMKNNNNKVKSSNSFLVFSGFIVFFWLCGWIFIDIYIPDVIERGVFGDKFGAINTLFSGLALAGIISTLLVQKETLKLQNEEFDAMLKAQRIQSFENSLFNMLSLQQNIVENLSLAKFKSSPYKGRDVFKPLYNNAILGNGKYIGVKDAIKTEGNYFFAEIPEITCLDHYFRHLYRIFKFIHNNDFLDKKGKYNYTSIVRSQLSDYELIILFYNCLSENGYEKFKPLVETYAIFKNIRRDLLAIPNDTSPYSDGAYRFVE